MRRNQIFETFCIKSSIPDATLRNDAEILNTIRSCIGITKAIEDWVPCYERNPYEDDEYFVTWTGRLGSKTTTKPAVFILEWYGLWDTHELEHLGYKDIKVLAWRKLPEAWKGEEYEQVDPCDI